MPQSARNSWNYGINWQSGGRSIHDERRCLTRSGRWRSSWRGDTVYRTARSLPIDYANLRKRLTVAVPPIGVARPEFVEVLMPPPAQPAACIEVLRIPVTGAVDFHQLFRAWRNGGR